MRARSVLVPLAALALVVSGCSDGGDPAASPTPSSALSTTASPAPSTSVTPSTSSAPTTTPKAKRTKARRPPSRTPSTTATPSSTPRSSTPSASARPAATRRLPLGYGTADARQVVTVVTDGPGDTTGTLQRWRKVGRTWRQVGPAVFAWVGAGGVGQASEGSTRTPAGSFTLTESFGRNGNPGTRLPYFATTPADFWMSSPGPRYNTHQRCGSCGYDNGTNEHLYEIVPEYQQAVVIDYNTRNAPGGVRPGAGSAFFLHVQGGEPTAGCVAIDLGRLVDVMRWLDPSQHPRILIGAR